MKRILSLVTALLLLFSVFTVVSAEDSATLIYEGSSIGRYHSESSWQGAANVNLAQKKIDKTLFLSPFSVCIEYEGDEPPLLVLSSWTGGPSNATVSPSRAENGVAYYPYAEIVSAFGDDFAKLNAVSVHPSKATVVVKKITAFPAEQEDLVSNYPIEGKAADWLAGIKAGWNLGNTLESYGDWIGTHKPSKNYETAWGNPVTTAEMFLAVKEAGFDAVRIPTTWGHSIDDSNNYTVDEEWMNRVQQVVDMALAAGLKVILNVHHDTGTAGWLRADQSKMEAQTPKFIRLWQQIAERFRDYGDELAFEGFNEILNSQSDWNCTGAAEGAAVNELNQIFVDTVRASGGANAERVLFVTSYAANNSADVLQHFVLPTDTAVGCLAAEIHMYTPINFCFTVGEGYMETDWTANNGKAAVTAVFRTLRNTFLKNGIPVLMGEFACGAKNNEASCAEWTAYVMECLRREGMTAFWWDNGGKVPAKAADYREMGVFDRRTCTWLFPSVVEAMTGVKVTNVHE